MKKTNKSKMPMADNKPYTKYQGEFGCTHDRAQAVMKVGKCTIVAGGAKQMAEAMNELKPDMLISVGGDMCMNWATEDTSALVFRSTAPTPLMPRLAKAVAGVTHQPKEFLTIDWPDMGVPPLSVQFWEMLAEELRAFKGTVAFFCMGGHGRTGTTLSILAHLLGATPPDGDPVKWVRDNYCKKCVESESQFEYLKKFGIKTKMQASKEYHHGLAAPVWNGNAQVGQPQRGDECDVCHLKTGQVENILWCSVDACYICDPCWKARLETKGTKQQHKSVDDMGSPASKGGIHGMAGLTPQELAEWGYGGI